MKAPHLQPLQDQANAHLHLAAPALLALSVPAAQPRGIVGVVDLPAYSRCACLAMRVAHLGHCRRHHLGCQADTLTGTGQRLPAKIINMSIGTVTPDARAYQRAINVARSGAIVAAAGNGNTEASKYAPPTAWASSRLVQPPRLARASFSNYGTRVNIGTGEDILTPSMNSLDRPDNTKFSYDYEAAHLHDRQRALRPASAAS